VVTHTNFEFLIQKLKVEGGGCRKGDLNNKKRKYEDLSTRERKRGGGKENTLETLEFPRVMEKRSLLAEKGDWGMGPPR